ncbi:MAG TPA: HAMP domain-containing sensor histidine kinase, partial [Sandaracinaceae bacterium LLY-WYZ-13_1]|nr:HAMP domain-containing sensor histidine kinase [Sandaracinaceae bacterium LLY-WYZ-13_1]
VRVRLVIAPALGLLALTFAAFEPTPWRRVLLATVIGLLCVVSYVEFVRYRNRGIGPVMVPLNLAAMVLGQLGMVTASGGLFSPVVPAVVLMSLLAAILVERRTILALVAVLQLPALWTLAWVHVHGRPVPSLVPALFGDAGALEHGAAPWIAAGVYSFMLLAAARVGALIRGLFEGLFDDAVRERDQSLRMQTESNRALTALSAELAHELKNPLASVKGLAALVAKGAEGKPAERLGVLRREVDRMQEILEELLNFSRPLVPLTMEEVDLGALVSDVLRLHEATAAERGVPLELRADAAPELKCDPRKVRQIVINLVQNALDASPPGAPLTLVVRRHRELAQVRVMDRGPGIPEEVAERVFEPGVTTKDQGSGLGLVVARGLARQHGGELLLARRDGGGTVAELTLPLAPAEAA